MTDSDGAPKTRAKTPAAEDREGRGDPTVVLVDVKTKNDDDKRRLQRRLYELKQALDGSQAGNPDLLAEREDVEAELALPVQNALWRQIGTRLEAAGSVIDKPGELSGHLSHAAKLTAIAYGILTRDGRADYEPTQAFADELALARAEYEDDDSHALYDEVLDVLLAEGRDQQNPAKHVISAAQWAAVSESLRQQYVVAGDPLLPLKARTALASLAANLDGGPPSAISIDLPELEDDVDSDIVQDNLQAAQAIYYAAMLEEVRLFQVVDKLVELFERGMLPITKSHAGDLLYAYWRKSSNRMSEIERRNLYARVFGFPGGDAGVSPNRDFGDLWLRFVSAVSNYNRQITVDALLRTRVPAAVSQEAPRKAGRDLAASLSMHTYGMAYNSATELQQQIQDMLAILRDEDVRSSYGSKDAFQVIDQVATLELGGARNSVRYRTMATSGAVIIRWLANHTTRLSANSREAFLDDTALLRGQRQSRLRKPLLEPTDRDLVDAAESWLAVTGTQESQIDTMSQPIEGPNTTARPIQIPQIARDLLDSVPLPINGAPVLG